MRNKKLDTEVFEEFVCENLAACVNSPPDPGAAQALLARCSVACPALGESVDGRQCLECDHFVRFTRAPDASLNVECWTHLDKGRFARGTSSPPSRGEDLDCGEATKSERTGTATKSVNHFEGVEQVSGRVRELGCRADGKELLSRAKVDCQRMRSPHTGHACLTCPHLINFCPSEDHRSVTVNCLWTEEDFADNLAATIDTVAVIPPTTTVRSAEKLADEQGIRYFVVSSAGRVVGIVCRCDLALASGEQLVDSCMSSPVYSVPASFQLSQVVEAMLGNDVGLLPVVSEEAQEARANPPASVSLNGKRLRGFVARSSFAEVGLGDVLGDLTCAACGSLENLHTHPKLRSVQFCLDCLEQQGAPIDYAELGVGD